MPASIFADRWRPWYGHVPPRAEELRFAFPERWLRIHTLPDAKRYASSPLERETVMQRYLRAASFVAREGEPCLVLGYSYGGETTLPADHALAAWIGSGAPALSHGRPELDEPGWSAFGAVRPWREADACWVLEVVAEGRLEALWVDASRGSVFAPYDGGADLFFPSEWERAAASDAMEAWRSERPDGL